MSMAGVKPVRMPYPRLRLKSRARAQAFYNVKVLAVSLFDDAAVDAPLEEVIQVDSSHKPVRYAPSETAAC